MRAGTILFAVTAIALLIGVALLRTWPTLNIVETGKTPEYPDIQPRTYRATVEKVYDAVLHAVQHLPRWALVAYQLDTGEVRAEATSRVFRFVDDVRIRVMSGDDTVVVEVRSASRVGRGDFGQNARNIRTFYRALDEEMERPMDRG